MRLTRLKEKKHTAQHTSTVILRRDYFKQYNMGLTDGIKALNKLPSAQPEHTETHSCDYQRTETHESCTDCPLYDHDRHNCPRFNKVIPTAILDAQTRWIPIKWHDCTDEEREEYGFAEEIVAVFDCEMPNDKQEILVTTSSGYVEKDVCYIDDGFSLDSGYDWIEDITAWMPLPEPYAERRHDKNDKRRA